MNSFKKRVIENGFTDCGPEWERKNAIKINELFPIIDSIIADFPHYEEEYDFNPWKWIDRILSWYFDNFIGE